MRAQAPAFSRRQRTGGDAGEPDDGKTRAATAKPTESTQTEIQPLESTETEIQPLADGTVEPARDSVETQPVPMTPTTRPDPKDLPSIEPPDPKAEPWPDATPQPMKPVDIVRPRTETVAMGVSTAFGRPPEMPKSTAPPPLVLGDVENPAHMPGPRDIPDGSPDDPAPAPGYVPPGDSRSLRRGGEFALVYRIGTCVITRTGRVGTRGQWRVVEYPTSGSAANSYAKESSRFVSDGFSDYRE